MSDNLDKIDEAIQQAVDDPASVSVDGTSVTARSIKELIEARKFAAAEQAASKNHMGLRFTKLVPPGGGGR